MGNLIGSFGDRGTLQTTPPPSPTGVARRRRGRKRGAEDTRTEGGDTEEVEELSPRRLVKSSLCTVIMRLP